MCILVSLASVAVAAASPDASPDANDGTEVTDTRVASAEGHSESAGLIDTAESEESDEVSGWFRVDTDGLNTQFWFGATHAVGGIDIASDIYVEGAFAELDVGVALSFGDIALTPMIGIGFDFSSQDAASLIAPQLFTIFDKGAIYIESWIQVFINSPFADDGENSFYTRNFVLYKVSDQLSVGPQVELSYRFNEGMDSDGVMFESALTSLPIGARANVGYGKSNTLGIFLGYDTEKADGTDGVAGRFTFVRTW